MLRGRHDARGDCGHCGRPVSPRRRANHHSIRPAQVAVLTLLTCMYKSYSTLPIDLLHKYQILLFVH